MTDISEAYILPGMRTPAPLPVPTKLRIARVSAGLDQKDVAAAFKIKPSAVSQWETGETSPARKRLPALAVMYNVPIEYFFEDAPAPAVPPQNEVSEPIPVNLPGFANMPRDVPIYGATTAGGPDDGAFNMAAEIIDYGRRPPALANAQDLYGLYVASGSMEPVYRRGDLVYVRRRIPPRQGDDVILQIKPDQPGEQPRCFIKRLVRRTATQIVVEQFNPPGQIEYPIDRVYEMHRVMTMAEVLGT